MLANNPTSFSANSGLGTVALGRGELQKALGYYEVALAQQPINVLALANLGLALGHLGRFREVVERVAPFIPDEAQIKRNPLSALAIARMFEVVGFAQVQLGQVSAGLAAYLRARDLDPTNPAMAANVAALQAQEHSPTRASVPGEAAAKH
jgi:tetratricopeptide (TPR) repeat protein